MMQEEYDSQSGSPGPSKRRRYARVSRACNECRVRKVRCNGRSPCEPCEDFERHCTFTSTRGQKMAGAPRTKILEDRLRRARSLITKFQAQNPSADLEAEVQSIFESPPGSPSTDSEANEVTDDSFGGHHNRQTGYESQISRRNMARSPSRRSSASEISNTPAIMTNNPSQLAYRPQPRSAPAVPMSDDALSLSMYSSAEMHYPGQIPMWDQSTAVSASLGYNPYFATQPLSYGSDRPQQYQPVDGQFEAHFSQAESLAWSYPSPMLSGQGDVGVHPPPTFSQLQQNSATFTRPGQRKGPFR